MSFFACVLQLCLLELEQVFLMFLEVTRIIINYIRPLQYLAALNYLYRTLLQKVQFLDRVLLDLVQAEAFGFDLIDLVYGDVARLAVVLVPLVVVHVASDLILAVLLILYQLLEVFVSILKLLVDVASVVSPGRLPMLVPSCQAKPTELVLARTTSHVVTPLILLDERVALGACLRVSTEPLQVLALILFLLQPFFDLGAVAGGVVLKTAVQTNPEPTMALGQIRQIDIAYLNDVVAILFGTPLHALVEIGKLLAMPVHVFTVVVYAIFRNFVLQILEEE